ncbi:cytochrome C biogenesis protein [Trinickia dabaoshanensis]|uniref:Cytochrome C biogenesis protein n=1 Tax=Trinickia dabaoshanensis TaxID=564714 RepID=A0A2N7VN11_9BURK|nr:cytochrome c biogenesis CcdA family protein [Trinickia dabaoshanensis]PMS18549.1 cytochrome C biogenesis protein [Trinickia dabaoshanensis]
MGFGLATYVFGYLSGVISTLSPCVLPLLPIVLGGAAASNRLGPLALTAGVMLSFTAAGTFLASVGTMLGFSESAFRYGAAILLLAAGAILLVPALSRRFASLASGVSTGGQIFLQRMELRGIGGQFVIGLTLGAVWSPCVGPTLGGAIALAARGKDLVETSMLMAIYALGAGTPMLLLGLASRAAAARWRGGLALAGKHGKYLLGGSLLLLGVLTLSGLDKAVEAWAVDSSPPWLLDLTTRI